MGSRLGRRVIHFANLPIKLLLPTLPLPSTATPNPAATTRIREFALKTIPSATKFEIKSVLESLYGFDVDEVRTLNMEGKKKKRGGILLAKPDYKKAYVTLKSPLLLSTSVFPIPQIQEERERTKQQQKRREKTTVVDMGEGKRRHWMEKGEDDGDEGFVEVGRDRWDKERREQRGLKSQDKRTGRGHGNGSNDRNENGGRKFPWSSIRGVHTR